MKKKPTKSKTPALDYVLANPGKATPEACGAALHELARMQARIAEILYPPQPGAVLREMTDVLRWMNKDLESQLKKKAQTVEKR